MTNQLQPPLSYHIDPTIYAGRPADSSGRLPKELRTYDLLDSLHISWIVCGEKHIVLYKAVEILYTEFGVERMAIVGGGTINAAFLNAGLLDEVSILLGPGIDGRKGMTAAF